MAAATVCHTAAYDATKPYQARLGMAF